MPDENPAAPAAAPAPGTQVPIPGTTPAPAPAAVAPQNPPKKKGPRGPEIRIPEREFKARLQREAASLVRQRLGVTLEEAEKIVKEGASTSTGTTPSAVADQAIKKANDTIARLNKELAETRGKVSQLEKRNTKTIERMNDRLLEERVRNAAVVAKSIDPEYAIQLYARAVKAAVAEGKDVPAVGTYFETLKVSHKHLFEGSQPAAPAPAAPAPAPVAPTTAPPESQQPGEVTPPAAPPGAPPTQSSVEDMSAQDFNRHRQAKYGFIPGT